MLLFLWERKVKNAPEKKHGKISWILSVSFLIIEMKKEVLSNVADPDPNFWASQIRIRIR